MNDIFSDLLDMSVIIYLDNILIYSDNMSRKSFGDSKNTASTQMLTNANFTKPNTLDTSSALMDFSWTRPKFKPLLIGQNHTKSKMYSLS